MESIVPQAAKRLPILRAAGIAGSLFFHICFFSSRICLLMLFEIIETCDS